MERCQGRTKAGKRCKRASGEDLDFCSAHQGQAQMPPGEQRSRSDTEGDGRSQDDYDDIDRMWGLATIGLVLGAMLLLRGRFRLF